jgi:mannose-6-phosphate isomerase-like protein (cupin superfamily)
MSSDPQPLWFLNTRVIFRRPSASSADGLSIGEHWMPFADSPPLHVHHREDEIFHVLEGVMRFRVGDQETVVEAGQSALAPKGVPHTFRVESEAGVRVLVMTPGDDFEGFVREASAPAANDGLPPATQPTPAMVQALAEASERHGITILGPPMAA